MVDDFKEIGYVDLNVNNDHLDTIDLRLDNNDGKKLSQSTC